MSNLNAVFVKNETCRVVEQPLPVPRQDYSQSQQNKQCGR